MLVVCAINVTGQWSKEYLILLMVTMDLDLVLFSDSLLLYFWFLDFMSVVSSTSRHSKYSTTSV